MQAQKYSIKEWPKDDRPREKLLSIGAQALSNAELIAILMGNGTRTHSAMEIGRSLLQRAGGRLQDLAHFSLKELQDSAGVGQAKAIILQAGLEIGQRMARETTADLLQITQSNDVANYLKLHLQNHQIEVFGILLLNQSNCVIHFEIISQGGITSTVVDPRVVIRKALDYQAVSIILCHNHPSGNSRPSPADKALTSKISEAALFFDIRVMDHIIITRHGITSFANEGLL